MVRFRAFSLVSGPGWKRSAFLARLLALSRLGARNLILAMVCLVPLEGTASAQQCSGNFTDISFGTVDTTTGLAIDATGTLNIQCQGLANRIARVCPNVGSGSGGDAGSGSPRLLKAGQNQLLFSLYRDPARTLVWGSYLWAYAGSFPSPQIDIALGGSGQATLNVPVYARILAGQPTAPAANYQSNFVGQNVTISSAYSTVGNCAVISGLGGQHPGFKVDATITRTCTLTTTPLNFGAYGALNAIIDGSGQLRVTCTTGTPYSVGLSGGLSGATSPTARRMTRAASFITYGLYGNAARTQPWFNTNAFYQATGTGTGLVQTLTVYGRIPVQATPPTGVYTDTVAVVITY